MSDIYKLPHASVELSFLFAQPLLPAGETNILLDHLRGMWAHSQNHQIARRPKVTFQIQFLETRKILECENGCFLAYHLHEITRWIGRRYPHGPLQVFRMNIRKSQPPAAGYADLLQPLRQISRDIAF